MDAQTAATNRIIDLFSAIYPIGEDLKLAILKSTNFTFHKRKTKLIDLEDVQKNIYYIFSGAIRTYHVDSDGNEITSWLLTEDDLAISVYSFFSQQSSFEIMETIEDCWVLTLSHQKLMDLYADFIEFNYIGRVITEQYYIQSEEKANDLRSLTAKQRYAKLINKQPDILKRIPLGYIASYLGITQSTLSRIRAGK